MITGEGERETGEAKLARENASLRDRLREAEETLDAIRHGHVDAVVVGGVDGVPKVYTLETADQTYRILVEAMREGALTLSADGTVLYCNRRLAALVGLPAERVVGGSLERFIAPADRPTLARMIGRGASRGEFLVQAADNRLVPAYFSFSPLSDVETRSGSAALCCVVTDLTEPRRASAALRVAHDRLLDEVAERERTEDRLRQSLKMEAVGQLTGGVAHDFNNLLMVIAGGLDMLDRPLDPARRQRLVEGMRQAAQRGAGLTRQLLAFSRKQPLKPEPVDLLRQVGGMRDLLDRSLRGDIQVAMRFAPDLWPVFVDLGELELVLLNLCVNARDAMTQGGTITIAGENAPALRDDRLTGDFVRLSVVDTGTGMSPEVIARAFEPFFTTKDVGKGSGLGLAQAYGFARGSGGEARIESGPGRGTTVTLLLPRSGLAPADAAPDERARPPSAQDRPGEGSRGCVLLVEDDDEVAALAIEMLRQLGYAVTRAASAQAALGAVADDRDIDLVFSDVMMPGGMDGVELARELRRRRADLPVVLTSGYAEAARHVAAADGFVVLPKPYRFEDLAKTLQAAARA